MSQENGSVNGNGNEHLPEEQSGLAKGVGPQPSGQPEASPKLTPAERQRRYRARIKFEAQNKGTQGFKAPQRKENGKFIADAWVRLDKQIREITENGRHIIALYRKVANGETIWREVYKEVTVQGQSEPEFVKVLRPYTPTVPEQMAAGAWLTDRGWGKAPQVVQIEDENVVGMRFEYRRWPVGYDPLAKKDNVIDGKATKELPPAPKGNGNGNGNGNGHGNGH